MLIAYAVGGGEHQPVTELRDVLTARREALDLTQSEVAKALDTTVDQLSRWERGYTAKIPGDATVRLMSLYRLSVDEVIAQIGRRAGADPLHAIDEKVATKLATRSAEAAAGVARSESEARRQGNREAT